MPEPNSQRPFRDLIRHTLVYGSGFVTMAVVSLILTPVYAHHLGPAGFGLLALMLVLYGLMKQVYDLGFMNSVGRFFFDDQGKDADSELGQMRITGLLFLAGWGAALTALLCIPAATWSDLLTGTPDHANLVRIVAVTLYAEALTIVPLTLIRMQERSVLFVIVSVARFVATLVLSIVFVAGLDMGVRGALLGNAVPAVGVMLLLLPEYLLARGSRPSRALLGRMLAFGLPFFPYLLATWLIEASDRYLLELFTTRDEVGWYALAYRIAAVMQISVAAFTMGWAPLRYRILGREDAQELYARLARYYVLAGSLILVALSVFARDLVALVAPPDFAPAAEVIPMISLAFLMGGLSVLMMTGMSVVKQTNSLAWIAALAAGVSVGINVLLIPVWGMHAAAATAVLANAILVAGAWVYSQRVYPVPYEWRRIGLITAVAAVVVAGAWLVSPPGAVASIGWAAVCWLLFVLLLVKTGAIAPAELARVRRAPAMLRQRWGKRATVG
jgi:O-antigen/teichoic acid export membrane protein